MVNLPWRDSWFKNGINFFKEGRESIGNNERFGQHSTSWNTENVALVAECVRKDNRQISEEIVVNILKSGRVVICTFCKTMHLHIDPKWWYSSSPKLTLMCFHIPLFAGLSSVWLSPVPIYEKKITGRCFVSQEDVKTAWQEALRTVSKNGFQHWFQKLYEGWQKCIIVQGNYFKGGCASVMWTILGKEFYTLSPNFWIVLRMSN